MELRLYVHAVTDAAVRVDDSGDDSRAVWLPRSLLRDSDDGAEAGSAHDFDVPDWLAKERGLV